MDVSPTDFDILPPYPCLTPPSARTPSNIYAIYTSVKSTFCRWQYWSIFVRLAVVGSQISEVPQKSEKIRTFKVIDFFTGTKKNEDELRFHRIFLHLEFLAMEIHERNGLRLVSGFPILIFKKRYISQTVHFAFLAECWIRKTVRYAVFRDTGWSEN